MLFACPELHAMMKASDGPLKENMVDMIKISLIGTVIQYACISKNKKQKNQDFDHTEKIKSVIGWSLKNVDIFKDKDFNMATTLAEYCKNFNSSKPEGQLSQELRALIDGVAGSNDLGEVVDYVRNFTIEDTGVEFNPQDAAPEIKQ